MTQEVDTFPPQVFLEFRERPGVQSPKLTYNVSEELKGPHRATEKTPKKHPLHSESYQRSMVGWGDNNWVDWLTVSDVEVSYVKGKTESDSVYSRPSIETTYNSVCTRIFVCMYIRVYLHLLSIRFRHTMADW